MKLDFLPLPDDERRLYIAQAAIRRSLSPVIMEKDFWVCWLLAILFESEFAADLVFAGSRSGRTDSSAVHGQGMTRWYQDHCVLSRRLQGFLR